MYSEGVGGFLSRLAAGIEFDDGFGGRTAEAAELIAKKLSQASRRDGVQSWRDYMFFLWENDMLELR
jgi:hypothetical protein